MDNKQIYETTKTLLKKIAEKQTDAEFLESYRRATGHLFRGTMSAAAAKTHITDNDILSAREILKAMTESSTRS